MARVNRIKKQLLSVLSVFFSFLLGFFCLKSEAKSQAGNQQLSAANPARTSPSIDVGTTVNPERACPSIDIGRIYKVPNDCERTSKNNPDALDSECKEIILNNYLINTLRDIQMQLEQLRKAQGELEELLQRK